VSERIVLQPAHWPLPKGFANGIVASGESIWLGGQIGWDEHGVLAHGLAAQVEQTLRNIVTVLAEGAAGASDIVRMTWYIVSVDEYKANLAAIGAAYRRVIGRHFPAMSVVQVVRLVEADALVEIEVTAVRSLRATE
jgi:enamine deaminase RidA (YjgF/YER057c/UK114 family)